MKMVEIFKTNVRSIRNAKKITAFLSGKYPDYNVNFDLEDQDKVLRVEGRNIVVKSDLIVKCLIDLGYHCELIN